MSIKKIYSGMIHRFVRAVVIDNRDTAAGTFSSFGHALEQKVQDIMASVTERSVGYVLEDRGVFVGYYLVDFTSQGFPFVAKLAVRKVFQSSFNTIASTVQSWSAQEYPLRVSA